MQDDFDVLIVGGGPAGLFAAYWLLLNTSLRVCLVDRGLPVRERRCPLVLKAQAPGRKSPPKNLEESSPRVAPANQCLHCKPACHILYGLGGAGLFSDGKLNFIHKLGKSDLTQFMPVPAAISLIEETEGIFNRFGMDGPAYPSDKAAAENLRQQSRIQGLDLLLIRQKHLGSDILPAHIDRMCSFLLEAGLELRTGENVLEITSEDGRVRGARTDKGDIRAKAVILAPGRGGADWMMSLASRFKLRISQRDIEVGVRVEVPREILEAITGIIYDPTFFVRTGGHDDPARTFCTNPAGFVSLENYAKFVCVNGYSLKHSKSDNSNFAFLSKVILADPVSNSHNYGEAIGSLSALIGGGKPLLQRFGDLKRGRRSTWQRIQDSRLVPTLREVTPGDISLALPGRILNNLVDGLEQLNKIIPGVTNEETLLYAPEIKFFSSQVKTNEHLETSVGGLFVAGDGPGVSGNIVAAAATGLIPAKRIGEVLRPARTI
ncbi:MAG: FAD-dependent oxidoreductase [Desulfovibrionaceae bacterium]|nr:FAD-dependent oxidoreductase [Desulfovibrionaceae bacterium]